jgi:site-specific DNA-methyltransferase (adenine-specific)
MTIELLNIDCMEYMATQPDNAFDLAIVDPPYGINVKTNMGRRAGVKNDNPAAKWDAEPPAGEYFSELFRVSKDQVVWGANHFISRMPIDSKCWLLWDKMFSEDVSFAQYEMAWTSFNSVAKKFEKAPNEKGRIHPTQKPTDLYSWIMNKYAEKDMRILDTHLGSGSSAIAAHYFGCDFVGCEIDADYYKAASERFDKETRQCAMF